MSTLHAEPVTHDDIGRLAERAGRAGQWALSSVLAGVAGTVALRQENALMDYLAPFSRKQMAYVKAIEQSN
jgi:hypothetical protein